MEQIAIEKIKTEGNPRNDIGDVTELQASIAEHGIIEPLIVSRKGAVYTCIAGHRRLAAAKALKMKEVPVVVRDLVTPEDQLAIALVENIQREDLSPIDEAKAFESGLRKFGGSAERMAKSLGKTKEYVERRIALLKLAPEAQKALLEKKIQLGHAVILARMAPEKQAAQVKKVISEKSSVHQLAEHLRWGPEGVTFKLKDACFDTDVPWKEGKPGCNGCPLNGGQQAILSESGESLKGICMGPNCFMQKTQDWIHEQTKVLKAKGVNIVELKSIKKDQWGQLVGEISSYDREYKEVMERLHKEPENFALVFEFKRGELERRIFCLKPGAMRSGRQGSGTSEKELAKTREERLENRMSAYWDALVVKKTRELAAQKPAVGSKHAKALAIFELLRIDSWKDLPKLGKERILKEVGLPKLLEDEEVMVKKLLSLPDETLDILLTRLPTVWLDVNPDLQRFADAFGFDAKKHFVIDEEFLNMHTTAQCEALCKELKIDLKGTTAWTKKDIMKHILAAETKGKVPKVVQKAIEVALEE
jgi:ParB/RepB/Spo0J family partition protein